MLNKDKIEKSLLLGVVRDKNWEIIILNNLTVDYFTPANRGLYRYIKSYTDEGNYPDLRIIANTFDIEDYDVQEFLAITDLDGLCDVIRKEYLKNQLEYKIRGLNDYADEMENNPENYIDRLGGIFDDLKKLKYSAKSVSLFEGIDEILTLDNSNVISTGFKELDEKLIGWKRGEELVILMGRTGQGKSWLGLKFAMAAALQGEKVGIYSGEMSLEQLQERILCCAKQNYTDTKEDALAFIKSKKIDIRVITQKELRGKASVEDIEAFIVRENPTMLVLDQLSLMKDCTSKGNTIREQYANITMDLFTLTSKYEIPIVLLVQSNRQGSDNKNGPALENIAESDAVAQNATRVISMKKENDVLVLNILKNRYGDSRMIQRYDVDYGINKYKPIQDYVGQVTTQRRATFSSMQNGRTF